MSSPPSDTPQPGIAGQSEHDAAQAWLTAVEAGEVRPLRRGDVSETDLDEELMLYDPADGATHALNVTAALVWEMCDGTATLDEIAAELAGDFSLPAEQARADAAALVEQLYRLGLLQTEQTAQAAQNESGASPEA